MKFISLESNYLHNNFNKIFKNIKNINYKDFNNKNIVNASKNSINQYKIVNMIDSYNLIKNTINNDNINENLKQFVKNCLVHLSINGNKIDIDDCVLLDLLHSDTQTFPNIHTDIEWNMFKHSDGFQLWYLYENDENIGNMFLIDTPHVISSSNLKYRKDKSLSILNHCGDKELKKFKNRDNLNAKVYYLNMKKGECLIFGKNLYHASDFRKSKYRYALNLRVIIKDKDGGIPIDFSEQCSYNIGKKIMINLKKIPIKNYKIYPGMFDLLTLI
jgi:hypothetical protein